jgi:TP901 family phage tail tape measure protein
VPLGVREILLVMRAKDEASRTIIGVGRAFGTVGRQSDQLAGKLLYAGSAIAGVGAGMAATGAAGLAFFKSAIDAAVEYRQQAALTKTQIDGLKVSVRELEDLGFRVASVIPVPLEQLQPALFDIFSSMDVNMQEAEVLLRGFAKSAVAGQVDVQTAGRATIAIMNAFKIPVGDMNKVLDFQFQLVRKGVGTYEEFASTIGRAIPSTVRAGQSVETLGGMLAFLTRNGLSTAMAASSAARALDAISNSKVQDRLEGMGIATRDANGQFRPLVDTLRDMNERMATMTAPEKARFLEDLFRGAGGTIQARRFFDTVFKNFDEFEQRVGEMSASKGALKAAYDTMFKQPASQAQLLNNQFDILKKKIGRDLIPIKEKLTAIGLKALEMWNKLSPGVRRTITQIVIFVAIGLTLAGIILTIVGGLMALIGVIALVVGSVTAAIAIVVALIAAAVILPLIALGIIKNWKDIGPFFEDLFNKIKGWVEDLVKWFQDHWDEIKQAWDDLYADAKEMWTKIKDNIEENAEKIWEAVKKNLNKIEEFFKTMWTDLLAWWNIHKEEFKRDIEELWLKIKYSVQGIWDPLKESTVTVFNSVVTYISQMVEVVLFIIGIFVEVVTELWRIFGDNILTHVKIVWDLVVSLIGSALDIVFGIIKIVTGLINGEWGKVWEGIKQVFIGIWESIVAWARFSVANLWNIIQVGLDAIYQLFVRLPGLILDAIEKLVFMLLDLGYRAMTAMYQAIDNKSRDIVNFMIGLPGKMIEAVGNIATKFYNLGHDVMHEFLEGIKSVIKSIYDKLEEVADRVKSVLTLGLFGSPWFFTRDIGRDMMYDLTKGITERQGIVFDALKKFDTQVQMAVNPPNVAGGNNNSYIYNIQQTVEARTEADPYEISRELAFMQKTNPYPMPTSANTR